MSERSERTRRAVERQMDIAKAERDEHLEKFDTDTLRVMRAEKKVFRAEESSKGRTTFRVDARIARIDAEIERRAR